MTKIGEGIEKQRENYVRFGSLILSTKQLDNGCLLVKYKSKGYIKDFPRRVISDELEHVFRYLLEKQLIDYDVLIKCSKQEQDLFETAVTKAGLKSQLKYDASKLIDNVPNLINRFEIVRGSVVAGNDNIELIQEAKELIKKLVTAKVITRVIANDILKELE